LSMKQPHLFIKVLLSLLFLLPALSACCGEDKPVAAKGLQAKTLTWIKNLPVEFLENKGQIRDIKNNPAPYVLFKGEAPGVDLYVTETGLSYVFLNYEEDEEKEEKHGEKNGSSENRGENEKIRFERVDMLLSGASIKKENIVKEDTGAAYYNYLAGSVAQSFFHVKKYRKVTIREVYPGIDWVLYSSEKTGFKYDFIVHPGADVKQIRWTCVSRKKLKLDEQGNLVLKTRSGHLKEYSPYSYFLDNQQKQVESRFVLLSSSRKKGLYYTEVGFAFPSQVAVNGSQTLIIDPQILWATFFGGVGMEGTFALDCDKNGDIYACGYGGGIGLGFPLLSTGTYFNNSGYSDYIIKFSNNGVLLWSTFFASGSTVKDLSTDANNNLYITGNYYGANFPALSAGGYYQNTINGPTDAYITKFDSFGNIVWSTLYGGSSYEGGVSVATDQSGDVYITGYTHSTDFPLQNAGTYFEPLLNGPPGGFVGLPITSFIVKFDGGGNRLWATYVSGVTRQTVTTDLAGNVYLTGSTFFLTPASNTFVTVMNPGNGAYFQGATASEFDAVILKFDNAGNQLWGTYYGGTASDQCYGAVCDQAGNLFTMGTTASSNLPLQNAGTFFQPTLASALEDIYLTKFDPFGGLQWATYLGGSRVESVGISIDNFDNLSIDTCGNLFVGFNTESRNLVMQPPCDGGYFKNVLDTSVNPNNFSVYLARFSNSGSLLWSSYLGGDSWSFRTSLASDRFGNTFVTGEWGGNVVNPFSYPIVSPSAASYTSIGGGGDDLYFVKIKNTPPVPVSFSYSTYCTNNQPQMPTTGPGFSNGGLFSSTPGLSLNPQNGQVVPAASIPGIYTVNYVNQGCSCAGTPAPILGSATVSILQGPLLNVSGRISVCVGETVIYTASGANSYSWNTGATTPTVVFSPAFQGLALYSVSGSMGNLCTDIKTFTVYVSKCLSFEETVMSAAGLSVYPNPNIGEFVISSVSDVEAVLVNELGEEIRKIWLSGSNDRTVRLQGLAKGVYFLKGKNGPEGSGFKIVVTE
jgi:hypothetical protein